VAFWCCMCLWWLCSCVYVKAVRLVKEVKKSGILCGLCVWLLLMIVWCGLEVIYVQELLGSVYACYGVSEGVVGGDVVKLARCVNRSKQSGILLGFQLLLKVCKVVVTYGIGQGIV